MNIIDYWLREVAEFDIIFKLVYLSVVTSLTILVDLILLEFVKEFPAEYISYSFFFLFFLIWIYRIMLSDLRADKKNAIMKKEKRYFLLITFADVLILNFWFLDSEFGHRGSGDWLPAPDQYLGPAHLLDPGGNRFDLYFMAKN